MRTQQKLTTHRHAARGFTMIESMVVVAVMVILATLAAPAMGRFFAMRQLENAARRLGEDLAFGRNEAVKRNVPVLMCAAASGACAAAPAASDWAQGWRVCYDGDADGACDATAAADPNPIRQQTSTVAGVTFTGPLSRLSFNPDGTIAASNFTEFAAVSDRAPGVRWTVRIAASGAVTVRKV